MKHADIHIPRMRRTAFEPTTPGAMPGTLVPAADLPPVVITRVEYSPGGVTTTNVPLAELDAALAPVDGRTVWVDITGIGDADVIRRVGAILKLHPLTMEDIVHIHQRPKLEEIDDYIFLTLRAVRVKGPGEIDNEQLSMVLTPGLLVSFQERPGDGFDPIRKRIADGKGPIRKRGADYLLYALLDLSIDNYFPVLEIYSEIMDQLEEAIRHEPAPSLSMSVLTLRRELRQLRRAVWPLRDIAGILAKNDSPLTDDALTASFRDCYDHVVQVADFVDGGRDRAGDLGDLYQAMVSEKTNQVMKTLTIVSTVFIPLTFLCGLYGMNFDTEVSDLNMPELKWRYGYVALWGVMIAVLGGMLVFFRRRGWIGR
jgi:magnesium transporter